MKKALCLIVCIVLAFSSAVTASAVSDDEKAFTCPYKITYSATDPTGPNAVKIQGESARVIGNGNYSVSKVRGNDTICYFKGKDMHFDYEGIPIYTDGLYKITIKYFAKVNPNGYRLIDIQFGDRERETLEFEQHGENDKDYQPYYATFETTLTYNDDTWRLYDPECWDDYKYMIIDFDWISYELIESYESKPSSTASVVTGTTETDSDSAIAGSKISLTTIAIVSGVAVVLAAAIIILFYLRKKHKK